MTGLYAINKDRSIKNLCLGPKKVYMRLCSLKLDGMGQKGA
jgi:hypothetical protein